MCFTAQWLLQLFIWAIIIGGVYALIKLLVPFVLSKLGEPGGILARAIEIILWCVFAIIVVYIVFDLISCLLGMAGGLRLPGAR